MIDDKNIDINLASRHVTRFIAILTLYSYSMNEQQNIIKLSQKIKTSYLNKEIFDLEVNLDQLKEIDLHNPDDQLLEQLILLSQDNKIEIQKLIEDSLIKKWNLNRIDRVLRSILELSALELLYCGDIPAKIIIDEYVSLTKSLYENSEVGFVNKVIDHMARAVRLDEMN